MPRLPQGELILELRKLEDYCLSPSHPRGRHKARVFREALGLSQEDAVWLRDTLLMAARQAEAVDLVSDEIGQRWRIDVAITRHARHAMIRTIWIMRSCETALRFVTCWVL